MSKTKPVPYGAKKKLIWKWLENPDTAGYSNCYIADKVGCHNTYVSILRAEMAQRVPKEEDFETRRFEEARVGRLVDEEGALLLDTPITPTHTPSLSVDVSGILDTRHKEYGTFVDVSKTATDIKLALREGQENNRHQFETDQLEALDLIATKLARIVNGNPDIIDHWDDLAGYAMLVSERLKGRSR